MALPLYAFTLFVSAFILFLVQPIVGKIILPKLGGTPQVWNTCMVFFQMVLLAGYAYTHNASTRLNLRQQLIAHAVLLFLPLVVLLPFPFSLGGTPMDTPLFVTVDGHSQVNPKWNLFGYGEGAHSIWGFVPELGANPIPSTLAILFLYVALPFLVVATTSPLLLQKWFAHTGHPAAKDPYFLYGASNFGSMLSLILYPFLIEPYVSLRAQGWMYTIGYFTLMVFVFSCAAMVWTSKDATLRLKLPEPEQVPGLAPDPPLPLPAEAQTGITATTPVQPPAASTSVKPGTPGKLKGVPRSPAAAEPTGPVASDDVTPGRRFRWVMLAMIPSSLMLGITTHITTDLSPIPLFWLVPLILYLLSFILVFARWPVVWTEQPHTYFVYAQPFFVAMMIIVDVMHMFSDTRFIAFAIIAHVLGFFTTTMVCHGELAKDRPTTKHLTEFYLWMSVGGMLGGMFNALIAPIIFTRGLYEFPLAIFAAGLARPRMFETGLGDNWLAGMLEGGEKPAAPVKAHHKGKPVHHQPQTVTANESLVKTLDWVWPLIILVVAGALVFVIRGGTMTYLAASFGIPLALCCVCMARPMRIGLGIGAVLLMHQFSLSQQDANVVLRDRSYFGLISVKTGYTPVSISDKEKIDLQYNNLVHGHIDHGLNFVVPDKKNGLGDPRRDWSRLATTYYHREGPVGRVMEKFNWFPGPPNCNTYQADARMPVSLISSLALDALGAGLPVTTMVSLWSEPPIATVGLGTGTMASYGRPYQHVHFYEIDYKILGLSLVQKTRDITTYKEYDNFRNSGRTTYFNYLERALQRGCTVQVLMGDARLRMALPYGNHYVDEVDGKRVPRTEETDRGGGPNNFYHMMVVDAFSSDAIPAHLLTEEAFKMYFTKLTEEGILCVHTSNRFVDLPKVVAAVSDKLGYKYLRGHDSNDDKTKGHYTSEWVMVARKSEYLKHLSGDTTFLEAYRSATKDKSEQYWSQVPTDSRYVWTDDYYNLMSVVRFR